MYIVFLGGEDLLHFSSYLPAKFLSHPPLSPALVPTNLEPIGYVHR